MADPIAIDCPAETWTLLASAVTNGQLVVLEPRAAYQLTYRMSPSVPPSTQQEIEDAPKLQALCCRIESVLPIDVYCYVPEGTDGRIGVWI